MRCVLARSLRIVLAASRCVDLLHKLLVGCVIFEPVILNVRLETFLGERPICAVTSDGRMPKVEQSSRKNMWQPICRLFV